MRGGVRVTRRGGGFMDSGGYNLGFLKNGGFLKPFLTNLILKKLRKIGDGWKDL